MSASGLASGRRRLPVLALCGLLIVLAGRADAARPNVLFVVVDDLNCDIACYGVAGVKTPRIDALAGRGVRFERAYAQGVACNPSRASLLTGRTPLATGVLDNTTSYRESLPDAVSLARHFRDHGYFTGLAGKLAHRGHEDASAWDRHPRFVIRGERSKESGRARKARRRQGDRWAVSGGGDGGNQRDYKVASEAISLLRQRGPGPFFIAVGFDTTHPPLVSPRRYYDLYEKRKLELPVDFAESPLLDGPRSRENTSLFYSRRASRDEALAYTRAYRAATSFVDAQLGRVLEELDRLELRDETLVVFASDHGFHLGDKGLWGKGTLYERGLRVPLVIAGPGVVRGGVSPRPVELLDLYPTLLELAGLGSPGPLDGRSLAPLLARPDAAWPHVARSWLARGDARGVSVRSERYRYTEWNAGAAGRELYDHAVDPGETRNLADAPEQAATIARLQQALRGEH